MNSLIIDSDTTDEQLNSLIGKVVTGSPVPEFGNYHNPPEIVSADRLRNGMVSIVYKNGNYVVFGEGKVVWDD